MRRQTQTNKRIYGYDGRHSSTKSDELCFRKCCLQLERVANGVPSDQAGTTMHLPVSDEGLVIGTMIGNMSDNSLQQKLLVNDFSVVFKLDTVAGANVLPYDIYDTDRLGPQPQYHGNGNWCARLLFGSKTSK